MEEGGGGPGTGTVIYKMVDLAFWEDLFEQDLSWDDSGTTISGI